MYICCYKGAIPESDVIAQIWILLLGGLGVSYALDVWTEHEFPIVLCLAVFGSLISYIYSAPPLKLKQSGWIGNYALGSSYISLPWWAGQVNEQICATFCFLLAHNDIFWTGAHSLQEMDLPSSYIYTLVFLSI